MKNVKMLYIDIETSPIIAYTWGPKWETSLIETIEESKILSYSAKWADGKHITKGLIDYTGYKPGMVNDYLLIFDLVKLLNDADIVVVWKEFFRPTQDTATLAEEFLKEIK